MKSGGINKYLVWLVGALALAIAVAIFEPFFVPQSAGTSGPAALAGRSAPVFPLFDDRGRPVSLVQYRGRVVMMNLWATWCPPCRAEMPDLQRLATRYAGAGLSIVGVNQGESPERARAFADSLRIGFPIWIDADQRYGRAYGALGLPTTVVLDRRGVVVRGFDGALTFEQMRSAVDPMVRSP
ncbi:MAG: TlpA disulfide reductase family protein [Candidatus Baltobacteraceae bacterium]